jgi:hypothetical protein
MRSDRAGLARLGSSATVALGRARAASTRFSLAAMWEASCSRRRCVMRRVRQPCAIRPASRLRSRSNAWRLPWSRQPSVSTTSAGQHGDETRARGARNVPILWRLRYEAVASMFSRT